MSPGPASHRYLSTRGGEVDVSFEDVVLKGLASDGGLFLPAEIPQLPPNWLHWRHLSFVDLAFETFSLYISQDEIPSKDLHNIIRCSYSSFREPAVTPLKLLSQSDNLFVLELFHGPTFAFKDVALQFLGNLFEYFLLRRNAGKTGKERTHLSVIGATSGDTGSAAIYGLRGKEDVSVFIMHPKGRISPIQEAQMTAVLDTNVHNIAVEGTFDDCQDYVKALFASATLNVTNKLAAVNSINWARILAQITYYFSAYFQLLQEKDIDGGADLDLHFVVPTGNFGDVLAGYFAKRMGLPITKLIVATNENDILYRFWQTGSYEKRALDSKRDNEVRETLSPAMDILVSSNFERLLWLIVYQLRCNGERQADDTPDIGCRQRASDDVRNWHQDLKTNGRFSVDKAVLDAARLSFASERVTDAETVETIEGVYKATSTSSVATNGTVYAKESNGFVHPGPAYVLDPHSAIGVAAAQRSVRQSAERSPTSIYVSLATAHPAKFSKAVELALGKYSDFSFDKILPQEFIGLEQRPRRCTVADKSLGIGGLERMIVEQVQKDRAQSA